MTKMLAPDGSEVRSQYNEPSRPSNSPTTPGQTQRTVDPWGRERWTLTDALGRLRAVVEPNSEGNGTVSGAGHVSTLYNYSALDKLVAIRQPDQQRRFRYNSLGRLTHQHLPEKSATLNDKGEYVGTGGVWSDVFTYDVCSNLATHTDARGVKTIYDYIGDPLCRLQTVIYDTTGVPDSDKEGILPASNVGYEYVTTGDVRRLRRVKTSNGVTEEYDYDTEGRLSSKKITLQNLLDQPLTIDYRYDSLNRPLEIKYPAQYGMTAAPRALLRHDYDKAGRLEGLTRDGEIYASQITYNAADQVESLRVGASGQITEDYEYNAATGLVDHQRVQRGSTSLLDLYYDYKRLGDSNDGRTGQLTRITDNINQQKGRGYEYDALGRLVRAMGGSNPATPLWTQEYSYDPDGNRTSVTATGKTANGTPIPLDGLAQVGYDAKTNRITTSGSAYDAVGNPTRVLRADITTPGSAVATWQRSFGDVKGVHTNDPGVFKTVSCAAAGNELHICAITNDGKVWHTIRFADGSWQGFFGDVKGVHANDPGTFVDVDCGGVGRELHICAITNDGKVWHTIRFPDGSWQGFFGDVKGVHANDPGTFVDVDCGGVGRELHICAITNDGKVWHTIRFPDGSWQGFFGDVKGVHANDPGTFVDVDCGGVGRELHVCAITNDGKVWHTIRFADGSWQGFFGDVKGVHANDPGTFVDVDCGGVGRELHVCAITNDGKVWHTIRFADGSWQGFFGDVKGVHANDPGTFVDVDCGGVGRELHVCAITNDGKVWHTIRRADGSWQRNFVDVKAQTSNPGVFKAVGCIRAGNELHVCAITNDGKVWHTIRRADGSWQRNFVDLKAQHTNDPGTFVDVDCGGVSGELHVCAITNNGKVWHTIRFAVGSWQRYQYDAAGRLAKVSDDRGTSLEEYVYGGVGRQRMMTRSSKGLTYYIWSGDGVVAEYTKTVSGSRLQWNKNYVYLGGRLLSTSTLKGSGEVVQYHHPDRLGTRLVTTKASNAVTEQVTLPFGVELKAESTGEATNRRFTTYERSATTGLDYAVNRFYDSQQGRFTQIDPLEVEGITVGDPQSDKLYAYVENDPINSIDPLGLVECTATSGEYICTTGPDGKLQCTPPPGGITVECNHEGGGGFSGGWGPIIQGSNGEYGEGAGGGGGGSRGGRVIDPSDRGLLLARG